MAKWGTTMKRAGDKSEFLQFVMWRNGVPAGVMNGAFVEKPSGLRYFQLSSIGVPSNLQKEFMEEHGGLKMDEVIATGVLRVLKKEGFSEIRGWLMHPDTMKLLETFTSVGVLKKTPKGWKINLEKVPATEEEWLRMIRRVRAAEARKKTTKKPARPRKPRRTRPR